MPSQRRIISAYAGIIFGMALSSSVALSQSSTGPQGGVLNNPKDDMVVPKPPSEGADGMPNAKDIPGAGPQTTPSTVSAQNAEKDKHPWLDRGVALTPEQKKAIYNSISTKLDTDGASKVKPQDVTAKLPAISDLKYVKTNKLVLLVNPPNNTVAAVITQ
jgi:hypothetical protein